MILENWLQTIVKNENIRQSEICMERAMTALDR